MKIIRAKGARFFALQWFFFFEQRIVCISATVVSAIFFLLSRTWWKIRDRIQFATCVNVLFGSRERAIGEITIPRYKWSESVLGGFGSTSTGRASYPVRSHLVRRRAFPRVDRKSRIGAAQIKLYRPRVYKRAGLSDCFSSLELQARLSLSLSCARTKPKLRDRCGNGPYPSSRFS